MGQSTKAAMVWSLPTHLLDESKSFDFNPKGVLIGYMTLYDDPSTGLPYIDSYRDIVEPGMCTKTISELYQGMKYKNLDFLLPYLWQHTASEPIGGVKHLSEDSRGVIFETHLARGVQRAEEALKLLEQKMMAGVSYGYDPIRYIPDRGNRRLKEIRLHEISQVTFPAHEYAAVNEIKAWFQAHPDGKSKLYSMNYPVTKPAKGKARDFLSLWQDKQPTEAIHELDLIGETLQQAILETATDAEGTDKQAATATIIEQLRTKLLAWMYEFESSVAVGATPQDEEMPMMMMGLHRLQEIKEGRMLSQANHTRLQEMLDAMSEHMKNIQELLQRSTQGDKTPANPKAAIDTWLANAGGTPSLAPLDDEKTAFLNEMRELRETLSWR